MQRMKKERKAAKVAERLVGEKTKLKRRSLEIHKLRESKFHAESKNEVYEERSSSMDTTTGITASSAGVELINRPVTSVAGRPGYIGNHDDSDQTILETGWDLERIVSRPTLITSFAWDPTKLPGTTLASLLVPHDLLSVTLAKIPFMSFLYWRGDVVLRFQVTGSPMIQGLLAATFVPLSGTTELGNYVYFSQLTVNPTVYMYANTNSVAELRIPYNQLKSYIPTGSALTMDNLGTVVVYPINILQKVATTPVTSISVSVFSMLQNSEFKVPRNSLSIGEMMKKSQGDPALQRIKEENARTAMGHGFSTFHAESGIDSGFSSLLSDIGNGTIDMVTGAMDSIGDSLKQLVASNETANSLTGTIEQAAKSAMPTNIIGDVLDIGSGALTGVLSLLGLDNPSIPISSSQTVVRYVGPMNYAQGPEYVEKLAINPASMTITTAESFATVEDEMSMDYLTQRYSYLDTVQITTSAGIGDIVYSMPICPFQTKQMIAGLATGSVPLITYLGIPFVYWTGPLAIKIQIVASAVHTGKLFVGFNFQVTEDGLPPTLADVSSQYGQVIELNQGSNEFEVIIPYVSSTPYKYVPTGSAVSMESQTGNLVISLLSPIVAPSSVVGNIEINLFMAGAQGFSYYGLGSINASAIRPFNLHKSAGFLKENTGNGIYARGVHLNNAPESRFRVEGHSRFHVEGDATAPMNIAQTVTDTVEEEHETAPPQVDRVTDTHFGILPCSLRELLKKYQYMGTLSWNNFVTPNGYDYSVGYIVPTFLFRQSWFKAATASTPAGVTGLNYGLFSWAAAMFRQWKGTVRFKLVPYELPFGTEIRAFWVPMSRWMHDANFTTASPAYTSSISRPGYFPQLWSDQGAITCPPVGAYATENIPGEMANLHAVSAGASGVVEIEVPWTTIYNSLLTDAQSIPNYMNSNSDIGVLGIAIPGLADSTTVTGSIRVYAAFGDETRFGTLCTIPSTFVGATYLADAPAKAAASSFPSTYRII